MISSVGDATASGAHAARLDQVLIDAGVVRNKKKDVTDVLNATCVGIAVEAGAVLGPPPDRCMCILVSLLFLLVRPFASGREVAALVGMIPEACDF